MQRISSQMNNNNTQSALRLQESRLNRANNQIGSQHRIQQLRDDPIAAGHLVRYQSYLGRVNQFEKNALTLSDQFMVREGYMTDSLEIMQILDEINKRGITIIVSTHDKSMVNYFRKRVLRLDNGEVIKDEENGTYE